MKSLILTLAFVPAVASAFPLIPMTAINGCGPEQYANLKIQAACNAKFQIAIGLEQSNGNLNVAVPQCAEVMASDYHSSMRRAENFCGDAAVDLIRHLPSYLAAQVLSH